MLNKIELFEVEINYSGNYPEIYFKNIIQGADQEKYQKNAEAIKKIRSNISQAIENSSLNNDIKEYLKFNSGTNSTEFNNFCTYLIKHR